MTSQFFYSCLGLFSRNSINFYRGNFLDHALDLLIVLAAAQTIYKIIFSLVSQFSSHANHSRKTLTVILRKHLEGKSISTAISNMKTLIVILRFNIFFLILH